jgi:hypothetical protein
MLLINTFSASQLRLTCASVTEKNPFKGGVYTHPTWTRCNQISRWELDDRVVPIPPSAAKLAAFGQSAPRIALAACQRGVPPAVLLTGKLNGVRLLNSVLTNSI